MLIKTLVLNGDESMLQIHGDLVDGFVFTVGPGLHEPLQLCGAVVSVDDGGVALGPDVVRGDFRGIVKDPLHKNQTADHSDDTYGKNTQDKSFQQPDGYPLSLHGGFRRYLLLFFRSLFLSIIHVFSLLHTLDIIANMHIEIKKKMKTSYLGRKNLRNPL